MDTFDHQDYEKYWYDHWVKKGCFKGQEIIARMEHLGKIKK